MDDGIGTNDPRTHGMSTTSFVRQIGGSSPFDHVQKVNQLLTPTKPCSKGLKDAVSEGVVRGP